MAETAAIFDLDRTLLAGASGPIISAALRDAGVISSRRSPARASSTACSTGWGRPCRAWRSRARPRTSRRAGARRWSTRPPKQAAEVLLDLRAAQGPGAVRPAPRRGPLARARDDDAVRLREAARRPARLRRCRRDSIRRGRRRHVQRHDRRQLRVGERQARRGAQVGRGARGRPRRELLLLRQRLRHAAAVGGRVIRWR